MARKKQTQTQTQAFDNGFAAFQTAGEKALENVTKTFQGYEQLVALGKANLDAVAEANTAAFAGVQRLNNEVASYFKAAYDANVAASKGVAAAKTVREAMELQTAHVEAFLKTTLAKTNEVSELAFAVANEVAQPLQARTKVAFDELSAPLAA